MIWSKYNLTFLSKKHGYLLYNTVSNCLLNIDRDLFTKIKNADEIKNLPSDIAEIFIQKKIIVDNDFDSINEIKYDSFKLRRYDKALVLTINPTLQCNFACSYCFEHTKGGRKMSLTVQDSIIEMIESYTQIEEIHITWFGGEPLLAFDVIENLSKRIISLEKKYSARMITNGYLLNDDIIRKLSDLKIHSLQITIDGLKETHDTRRPLLTKKGTFDIIIGNIQRLLELSQNTSVIIRINIDKNNENEFIDLHNYLNNLFYKKYSNRYFLAPGFVDNSTGSCISASDCIFDRNKKVDFLNRLYSKHKLAPINFYPSNDRYECLVKNPMHFSIGPKGEIYKCWNDIGNTEKEIGNIAKKTRTNPLILNRYYMAADPFEDRKCQECIHLPSCGGGCPYLRIENLYNNTSHDVCAYIKDHEKIFLENHYEIITSETHQKK